MSQKLKIAAHLCFAGVLLLATPQPQANAGGFSITIGRYGFGSNYYSRRPHYGGSAYYPGYSRYRSYSPRSHGHFGHPRVPHYDYHRPQLIPHGNHLDYIPGHWDLHHRGHFHH